MFMIAQGGPPKLQWTREGAVHKAHVLHTSKLRGAAAAGFTNRTLSYFATVRPTLDANGMMAATPGFVVSTNSFDDLAQFDTFEDAKRHVEAVFALSQN